MPTNQENPTKGLRDLPQDISTSFAVIRKTLHYRGIIYTIIDIGIKDHHAYAKVQPRNEAVELAIIDQLETEKYGTFSLDKVQQSLTAINKIHRYFVRLTSTSSPWFIKAQGILSDASRGSSFEYQVMSRLMAPGTGYRCAITVEEGHAFSTWAKSLGEERTIEFFVLQIEVRG
jgi:hypothetical protein